MKTVAKTGLNKNGAKQKLLRIRVVHVQSNGHPPERKPVIMCRRHIWSVERIWVENPTTIQTRISKETKRFSRMVIGFPAADLLTKQKTKTKGAVLGVLNKKRITVM